MMVHDVTHATHIFRTGIFKLDGFAMHDVSVPGLALEDFHSIQLG